LCLAGQVDAAIPITQMKDIYGVTPNAVVYNAAISACARAADTTTGTAWKLLDQTVTAGIPAVVGYNAALSAAARAGDYIAALQLFDTMLDESQNQRLSDQVTAGTGTGGV
jgi:pentatricopeptide repeat protein